MIIEKKKQISKIRLGLLNLQLLGFDERQRGLLQVMERILAIYENEEKKDE